MTDASQEKSAPAWTPSHAYVLAVICLLVGIAVGYLLRGSGGQQRQNPATLAAPTPQTPNTKDASLQMPSGDQMKHMADKAAEPLVAALQKDPNDPEVLARLASVYFRTRQFPLAVEYNERAVKAKPSAEGYVSLSNSYHYAGADDLAIDALNRALQLDPKSPNALFNLGMLQWQVKNDPKAAIAMWKRLLKTNPGNPRRADVEKMIAKARKHMESPAEAKD